ncbi:MAG: ATP-binding protein [Ignavibacteriales bacterium]|nr:ATP-binding protein [Ignavibacteriales bacterium]
MNTQNLKIESRTEKLSFVREFISDAARKFGFDDESVSKIALAVDEACTNIIKHAYELRPNNLINIEVITNKRLFEVVITHQGKLFDPKLFKSPDMKEYILHPRRGGLGIHLMRLLMDNVEYKTLPDQRCEVHLIKKLPTSIGQQ